MVRFLRFAVALLAVGAVLGSAAQKVSAPSNAPIARELPGDSDDAEG